MHVDHIGLNNFYITLHLMMISL